jgi:hypothetical protein
MISILCSAFKYQYGDKVQFGTSIAKEKMHSAVDKLYKMGVVTKDAKIDRDQPLGVHHISIMVQAMFNKALSDAATSWDATIQFSLFLVLQPALNCRVGDILAPGYKDSLEKPKPALW